MSIIIVDANVEHTGGGAGGCECFVVTDMGDQLAPLPVDGWREFLARSKKK